jgi:signal peptidase I
MVGSVPGYAPNVKRGLSTGAIVAIIAGCVAMALVVVAVVFGLVVVGSNSIRYDVPGVGMEPTIRAGQRVTATKVDAGEYRPSRGDIVVFTAPAGWFGGDRGQQLIKRVIGLPGERLACCSPQGQWMVNGTPLDEAYVKPGGLQMTTDIVVPDGRLWVMGDNRAASDDSSQRFAVARDIDLATIPVSAVTAIVNL